ncbi:hypothetical protein LOTGIDRAFT_172862 [Lottia gigantea]|uniref:C-type lectin domain-containing protein n=1 Tax=Lottia gigantea TaxID=225164 RepID=V4B4Z6_LOTGI|nr:hypothetical protein LOTGIDRAFT_172862 [Lottia gigantea]ESP01027.1 hypothetical protein LOTGIDRAFT_172862 [Lottia gigantea]
MEFHYQQFREEFLYTGPVTFNYYSLIPNSSLIYCTATCSSLYNWDQIYYQGEDCYCLAPVYMEASQVSGTVTTNSSIRIRYHDVSFCSENKYTTFLNQRYCLKLFRNKQNFINAESTCQQDGGHIISVYTLQDFNNFKSLNTNNVSVYVGGHRSHGKEFVWITGGTVDESFWKSNEPDDNGGSENCIEVQSNGPFNDMRCNIAYAFICQILIK